MDDQTKKINAPPLTYFSQIQLRDIHSASLEILEHTGTVVHHREAIHLLKKQRTTATRLWKYTATFSTLI